MFPQRMNQMVEQLVQWGYSRYLVENMDQRRLLICYGREKEIRVNQNHKNYLRKMDNLEAIFSHIKKAGPFNK